eukprot:CAMPEP_0115586512 /NCGR_PEP_ID=MMETSP0272-20121206/7738_1 /TAXON_ID=71861 /ORGANISM="Scrippsiella trochoidea, Strain CCMP3099" /LENGTH=532 /DNA_ID=CAMNT_0003021581 /DNA_START=13 /DNA_END=1608 /DNA_ORIENTATION=+
MTASSADVNKRLSKMRTADWAGLMSTDNVSTPPKKKDRASPSGKSKQRRDRVSQADAEPVVQSQGNGAGNTSGRDVRLKPPSTKSVENRGLQMDSATNARLKRLATIGQTGVKSSNSLDSSVASNRQLSGRVSSVPRSAASIPDSTRSLPGRPVRQVPARPVRPVRRSSAGTVRSSSVDSVLKSSGPARESVPTKEEKQTDKTEGPVEQAWDPNLALKICCGPWVALAGLCDQAAGVCGRALLRHMPTPQAQSKWDISDNLVVRGKGDHIETAWPALYRPRNADTWDRNVGESPSPASPDPAVASNSPAFEAATPQSGGAYATSEAEALTPEVQNEFNSLKEELRSLRVNFEHLQREHSDLQTGFFTGQPSTTLPVELLSVNKSPFGEMHPFAKEPMLSSLAQEPLAPTTQLDTGVTGAALGQAGEVPAGAARQVKKQEAYPAGFALQSGVSSPRHEQGGDLGFLASTVGSTSSFLSDSQDMHAYWQLPQFGGKKQDRPTHALPFPELSDEDEADAPIDKGRSVEPFPHINF